MIMSDYCTISMRDGDMNKINSHRDKKDHNIVHIWDCMIKEVLVRMKYF